MGVRVMSDAHSVSLGVVPEMRVVPRKRDRGERSAGPILDGGH